MNSCLVEGLDDRAVAGGVGFQAGAGLARLASALISWQHGSMPSIVNKLLSKTIAQFAGAGVGIDQAGRLCLPDGLDADRAHRFIEIVLDERFEHPQAALRALFLRLGMKRSVVETLDKILGEQGEVDFRAIGSNPVRLARVAPAMLEIPGRIQQFLVEGLGFADAEAATLEEAVVSTRKGVAAELGCASDWDEILARPDEVAQISRPWRERTRTPASS